MNGFAHRVVKYMSRRITIYRARSNKEQIMSHGYLRGLCFTRDVRVGLGGWCTVGGYWHGLIPVIRLVLVIKTGRAEPFLAMTAIPH